MISLGFDTSCYTTSVAAFDGEKAASYRKILEVKKGARGLRQSDALFLHTKNLPVLFGELAKEINCKEVCCVGVSARPRDVEGSYMPVFLAGVATASAVAASCGVPLYKFSHQAGHIAAGLWSAPGSFSPDKPFLSVHLSGGTTEILLCRGPNRCEIVGETLDIAAGQLVDRVGVKLSLSFPCGKAIDELSQAADRDIAVPISVKGRSINLAGAENFLKKRLEEGEKPENVAKGALLCIGKSLVKAVNQAAADFGVGDCLFVGGVASNRFLREYFAQNLTLRAHFAAPEFASDNAVGAAVFAMERFRAENECRFGMEEL